MDADDKQKIDKDFKNAQGNLESLKNNVNFQIKINKKFENTINNIIDKINNQNNIIMQKFKEVKTNAIENNLSNLKSN